MQTTIAVSGVRPCRLAGFSRAAWYRRIKAKDEGPLRPRIREIAEAPPRFGYNRADVLLHHGTSRGNLKRVQRLYRPEGLHESGNAATGRSIAGRCRQRPACGSGGVWISSTSIWQRGGRFCAHRGRSVEAPEPVLRGGPAGHLGGRRGGAGSPSGGGRLAAGDHRGSRDGVYVAGPRRIGLCTFGHARLHPA